MDIEQYSKGWAIAEPLMRAKLEQLKQELATTIGYVLSDIYQGGDEEFRLTLDLRQGDIVALGIDFVLLDADVNGADEGFGVKLDLVGYGALVLGGYAPYNFTEDAFTSDLEEVARRVNDWEVGELVTFIVNSALKNETLLKEIAAAT